MQTIIVTSDDANRRIDKYLSSTYKIPYSNVMKQFRKKNVKVNGLRIKDHKYLIKTGDEIITFFYLEKIPTLLQSPSLKKGFKLIHEDENLLIVDKDRGVVISGSNDSLLAQIRYFYSSPNLKQHLYPINVHQIDKATRGLVVFARNYKTLISLQKNWLNEKMIYKKYLAKLSGEIKAKKELINYLLHDELNQKQIVVKTNKKAKKAHSILTPLFYDSKQNVTVCEIMILTGRKHQIRVQTAHINHPVVGDFKYGVKGKKKLFLIAYEIGFNNFKDHLKYLNSTKFLIKDINWINK